MSVSTMESNQQSAMVSTAIEQINQSAANRIAGFKMEQEVALKEFVAKVEAQRSAQLARVQDQEKARLAQIELDKNYVPLIPASAIINQTYNGLSGCACGCGGDYSEKGEKSAKVTRRINSINSTYKHNKSDVEILDFGNEICYEIITGEVDDYFDRVTRVYVLKAGN